MHESGHPIVVFMGGDSSMNEFFVQSRIGGFGDMRGQTLIVDAPDTAYALQAEKILADRGLKANVDYQVKEIGSTQMREQALKNDPSFAASILNPPFSLRSQARGMKSLGRVVDLIGRYQATGAFALRDWFGKHPELIERYVAAYLGALRWVREDDNRDACVALLSQYLDLDDGLAGQTMALLLDPKFGLTPCAELDREGFRNVLRWRIDLGYGAPGAVADETRYVDLACYERVMNTAVML
jgi:ABC-type nitrate/sulfonate/bicarbonate transport system substrate-binding protein